MGGPNTSGGFCVWQMLASAMALWATLQLEDSSEAHYLRASSRWLVRESNRGGEEVRVKLACVNWAAHLEPMIAEGLNRQPIYRAAMAVKAMGFNCVRLTWATRMLTQQSDVEATVAQRLRKLNLESELRGLARHNPGLVNLTLGEAFAEVAASLGGAGLYVVADNHVSKGGDAGGDGGDAGVHGGAAGDDDGFWSDPSFDPSEWLQGLSSMANLSISFPSLTAISLRNELRGPNQNLHDWSNFISMASDAVFSINPRLLIIISGLHSDTDLHFLRYHSPPYFSTLPAFLHHKLAYEMHWFSASYGVNFGEGNLNQACAIATSTMIASGGFMASSGDSEGKNFSAPLMISEFGWDQRGSNRVQERYISCLFAIMAEMDLDWSYWSLQGSYYLRNGRRGDEEFLGVLNSQWNAPRNHTALARLQSIQQPWKLIDSTSSSHSDSITTTREYHIIFHPSTGSCLHKAAGNNNSLVLGPCSRTSITTHWRFNPQGRIQMLNSFLCIAAQGEGQLAKLEVIGTEMNGPWSLQSVAKLQLGTKIQQSNNLSKTSSSSSSLNSSKSLLLCLDGSNPPLVTTQKCKCVQADGMDCGRNDDPSHQWFVLVSANIRVKSNGTPPSQALN